MEKSPSVQILQIAFNIQAIKLIFYEIQYLAMLAVTERIYPLADLSQHYSEYYRPSVHWHLSDPGCNVIGPSHPENLMSSSNLQKCQNVVTLKINNLLGKCTAQNISTVFSQGIIIRM